MAPATDRGTAVLRMTVTPRMVDGDEIAHGGCLFVFADTRFGRSGIYDVSVLRGDKVIAEFRGRSLRIKSTKTKESP